MPDPTAAHLVYHAHPFAIHFWGEVGIRWYGLAYLAGIAWGYWMMARWLARGRNPLSLPRIQDFVLYAGLGMIIGGRVFYCVVYGRDSWADDWLYLFKPWKGGMASHGGILGMAFGTWLYARKAGVPFMLLADQICAVAPMGVLLGRLANFANGELWGKPGDVPWALIFADAHDGIPRHPSQLYESFLEGLLLLIIIVPVHARHRRPGLTTGILLMLYACARFTAEFWRQPDSNMPPFFDWMNMGQALSLPVLIIGAVITVWAARRPPRPEIYTCPVPLAPPADQPAPAG